MGIRILLLGWTFRSQSKAKDFSRHGCLSPRGKSEPNAPHPHPQAPRSYSKPHPPYLQKLGSLGSPKGERE